MRYMGNSREHDASKDRYADSDLSDFRLSDGRTSLGCFWRDVIFAKPWLIAGVGILHLVAVFLI
jgi:hypothetical protein